MNRPFRRSLFLARHARAPIVPRSSDRPDCGHLSSEPRCRGTALLNTFATTSNTLYRRSHTETLPPSLKLPLMNKFGSADLFRTNGNVDFNDDRSVSISLCEEREREMQFIKAKPTHLYGERPFIFRARIYLRRRILSHGE